MPATREFSKPTRFVVDGFSDAYPIQPKDILGQPNAFSSTFGKAEVEGSARNLVEFMAEKGRWVSFTIAQLQEFYDKKGRDPASMFYGICGGFVLDSMGGSKWYADGGYLVQDDRGGYCVTDLFIDKCAGKYRKLALCVRPVASSDRPFFYCNIIFRLLSC